MEPGATSSTLMGTLEPSASGQYVLFASAGQTHLVDLSFTEGKAGLVILGRDGAGFAERPKRN
jgi:hypothetical protein